MAKRIAMVVSSHRSPSGRHVYAVDDGVVQLRRRPSFDNTNHISVRPFHRPRPCSSPAVLRPENAARSVQFSGPAVCRNGQTLRASNRGHNRCRETCIKYTQPVRTFRLVLYSKQANEIGAAAYSHRLIIARQRTSPNNGDNRLAVRRGVGPLVLSTNLNLGREVRVVPVSLASSRCDSRSPRRSGPVAEPQGEDSRSIHSPYQLGTLGVVCQPRALSSSLSTRFQLPQPRHRLPSRARRIINAYRARRGGRRSARLIDGGRRLVDDIGPADPDRYGPAHGRKRVRRR